MKKIIAGLGLTAIVIILSACSSEPTNKPIISNVNTSSDSQASKVVDSSNNMSSKETSENKKTNETVTDQKQSKTNPHIPLDLATQYTKAIIKTNLGNIEVQLEANNAPLAVNNFLNLAQKGFYDGTKFHRVIKGFMIQGGDPNSKDETAKDAWGTGGPGYKFKDELTGTEKYTQGTLAMANAGPNTNGSQFFIVTASPSATLPPSYTIFGHIVTGMDVALKIEKVATEESDRPVQDVVIKTIEPVKK